MIKQARAGGSVNPTFNKILKQYVKAGRLDVKTNTTVDIASYDPASRRWSIGLLTTDPRTNLESMENTQVDYVVCSTGSAMAFEKIPFIQPLLDSHPIEMVRGAPRLTEDLQWSDELPAFVMGAYSILEVSLPPLCVPCQSDKKTTARSGRWKPCVDKGRIGKNRLSTRTAGSERARRGVREGRAGGELLLCAGRSRIGLIVIFATDRLSPNGFRSHDVFARGDSYSSCLLSGAAVCTPQRANFAQA